MVIIGQFAKSFRRRHVKRRHLFEFMDQTWFPKLFRGFITDLIQYQLAEYDVYAPIVPKIKEVMQKLNCRQIIDL
jgi:hypothetical protein